MIHDERIISLNTRPENTNGRFVLYWMQASMRTRFNHALVYAIHKANERKVPLIVFFQLIDNYPEANARHYSFLGEGLKDITSTLQEKHILFLVGIKNANHTTSLEALARDARLVVTDRGYTRFQKTWREEVASTLFCPLIQVESDVVIPVETTSNKVEYSAATIRKKIHAHLKKFLVPVRLPSAQHSSLELSFPTLTLTKSIESILSSCTLDKSVSPSSFFIGGESEAQKRLETFINNRLLSFNTNRSDPSKDATSHLSPYLHFGHISPLDIALKVLRLHPRAQGTQTFIEELIVRRELAMSFVHYHPRYDSYESLPNWAQKTLSLHKKDKRPTLYTREQFENAQTHDPYWNTAQREMLTTGYMHNSMRMYWGKKILEWSKTPEEAFDTALSLNNKYELDGRDPNSYAGVGWCFGLHDRPWAEREIFGMVRYMNDSGLQRKFNMSRYLERVSLYEK